MEEDHVNKITSSKIFIENERDLKRMREERMHINKIYAHQEEEEIKLKPLYFLTVITTIILAWVMAQYFHHHLPSVPHDPAPEIFSPLAAYNTTLGLTRLGRRPAGSEANQQAVVYLKNCIEDILGGSSVRSDVSAVVEVSDVSNAVDVSDVSGTIEMFGRNNIYSDIPNLVVRLSSGSSRPALLLNCHFDSAVQGEGASDNAVNCGIMVDIIRVIVTNKQINLINDVIFLFNGAEESGLLSAHGFITQHAWADDVAAFINLEGAGSGGRELLFQSGSDWILQSYIRSAPHPFASVIGQEIFQSGLIPSDTDYRVFRDHGHVPGLDIAYVAEGYVYHTEYDTAGRIPLGTIQRAGENILAVTLDILDGSIDLSDTAAGGSSVFFDVFGLFMIVYPSWAGIILNIVSVLLTLVTAGYDILTLARSEQIQWKKGLSNVLIGILFSFLSMGLAVGLSIFIGFSVGSLGFSLSWFSKPSLLLFLYSVPTMAVFLAVFVMLRQCLLRKLGLHTHSKHTDTILSYHSQSGVFSILCIILTSMGVDSAFMFSMPLYFNLLWWGASKLCCSSRFFLSFQSFTLTQFIPLALGFYVVQLIFTIFIPVMGRFGSHSNPDILIGGAVALFTLLLLAFLLPVLSLLDFHYRVFLLLLFLLSFIITILAICFSGAGFPYSDNILHPRPQRLSVYHTRRTVSGDGQNMEDSFYYISR